MIVIPAITPLTKDHKLDHGAVEKLFANFYHHDVLPFILGTTGESASLPVDIKEEYIDIAVANKKQGTTLYAGISSNCLSESIDLAKKCFDSGVDVVATTLPSYYSLSSSQMKKYFEELADSISCPLIIYNIPATTHMSIPLEIIDELSHHTNIVGCKDSERSKERLQRSIALWKDRKDFSHFVGWAGKSAEALLNGSGIIPSTGNLYPAVYSEMKEAATKGNVEKVNELQKHSDILGALYQEGRTLGESLWALKYLMKQVDLCEAIVMPPLQSMSKEEEIKLQQGFEKTIKEYGLQF
jgi:4-hydroxy-tetrahydrodipicolinate synthase